MRGLKHRLCSCTLVLMLLITLCPIPAKAASEYTYLETEDGTIVITGYTGDAAKLDIPETMDGKTVTGIADGAFAYDLSIREVELPDTVTEIGEGAFNDCSQLKTINFPESLTAIEKDAFFSCTRLEEAELPDGLEVLGDGAFYRCSALEEITVPGEVDVFGDYVFGACENLQSAVVEEGVEEIPQQTFYSDSNLSSIELPSTVKEIGMRAFDQCTALTALELPDGLESIGYRAFYSTSVESFTVNAVQIGKEAFYGTAATEIILGPDVAEIEDGALDNLKIQIDPENENFMVTEDGVLYTKDQRELVSVPKQFDNGGQPYQVPDGVEIIRNRAFQYCYGVTEVVLPDTVTTIGDDAFENSSLTKINLPDSITEIGEKAFSCIESLEAIEIPSSVKELKAASFSRNDGLSKVILHEGLEKIDDTVFAYCKNLEELEIPASVTELNGSAFYQYYPVEDESYETLLPTEDGEMEDRHEKEDGEEEPPKVEAKQSELKVRIDEENPQFKTGDDGNIYSLDGSALVAYINHPGETAIEIPDTVSTLRSKSVLSMFAGKITVPTSVTTIEENALGYFVDYYCKIVNMSETHIYSQEDTAAEEYAKENGIAFYTGTPSPNATEITLQSGETFQYQIENAPEEVLTYASSDNLIASVDQSGCITAKANGTAEIFALNGNNETQSVRVTVQGGEDPVDPYADYQEFTSTETYENWESDYYDYNKEILALENPDSEGQNELTKEDNSNIVDYSSNNYPAIKAQLIGGKYIQDAEEQFGKGGYEQFKTVARNLHEEAGRYDLNQNLKAYSGTSDISFITGGGSTLEELLDSVGKTVTDPCVISTSLAHSVAATHGKYMMEIYLPKDQTNGVYIKSISAYPSEYEFLLNYGLSFKVVDAGIRTVKVSSYPEPNEEYSYDVTERYIKMVVTSEPDDPDDPVDPDDPDKPNPDDPVKPDPENPDKPDPSNNKKSDSADKKNTTDSSKTRKKASKTGDDFEVQRGIVLVLLAGAAIVLVYVVRRQKRKE